jgi:hypothetical protein
MRLLLLAILLAATGMFHIEHASAQEKMIYPWCSQTTGIGSTQCTYPSFQECMFDTKGISGVCTPNATYDKNAPNAAGFNARPPQ